MGKKCYRLQGSSLGITTAASFIFGKRGEIDGRTQ